MLANDYDAVFACTPAAIAIISSPAIRKSFQGSPRWIAAISDIHLLVIARLAQNASKNHRFLTRTIPRLVYNVRSHTLAVCAMAMLLHYDHHLVQSEKEAEWIRRKGQPALASRTIRLTSAVSDQLFSLPTERTEKHIAFVGVLSALYAGHFEWFIHNVWKNIDAAAAGLKLAAVGRGASDSLQATMREHNVQYLDFVENLEDICRNHDILVAPTTKDLVLSTRLLKPWLLVALS